VSLAQTPAKWPAPEAQIAAILAAICSHRLRLSSEQALQLDIAEVLTRSGIAFEREVKLSPHDRLDFLCGGVAIEAKIQGSRLDIYRQCARYCARPEVAGLVLATNIAMALPLRISGKPVAVAALGKAWL
jgi:hypothetical protein